MLPLILSFLALQATARHCLSQVNAVVSVDFTKPTPVPSQSGFLHGANANTPGDSLLFPLRPVLWRDGRLTNLPRAAAAGAAFQLVLSDTWPGGYVAGNMPYQDWTAWEAHVRSVARSVKGKDVIWDIWNEPVGTGFFPGTQEQYFETYKRAYQVIRAELGPDAKISGPCLDSYREQLIRDFLEYCLANKLEVNLLTWHELGVFVIIPDISAHLMTMRKDYVENTAYAALKLGGIQINEVVSESDQYHPGETVGWLDQLERGGADAAARGCWNANCGNNTLDGILEPGSYRPRSTWWAYRYYADGVATRVQGASSDDRVAALASRESATPGHAQVLLGHFGRTKLPSPVTGKVTLRLTGLLSQGNADGAIALRVLRLRNVEADASPGPEVEWEGQVPLVKGAAAFTLADFRLHDAYAVSVGAAQGDIGFTAALRPPQRGMASGRKASQSVTAPAFTAAGALVGKPVPGLWHPRRCGPWFRRPAP